MIISKRTCSRLIYLYNNCGFKKRSPIKLGTYNDETFAIIIRPPLNVEGYNFLFCVLIQRKAIELGVICKRFRSYIVSNEYLGISR